MLIVDTLKAIRMTQQMKMRERPRPEGMTIRRNNITSRNNITVIRVETPDGVGAYRCGSAADRATRGDLHNRRIDQPDFNPHPSPWEETFKDEWHTLADTGDTLNWYFAFANVAQLLEWFNTSEALKLLESDGLICREYECEPGTVITGGRQVVFRRGVAKESREFELTSLIPGPPTFTESEPLSGNARSHLSTAKIGRYSPGLSMPLLQSSNKLPCPS